MLLLMVEGSLSYLFYINYEEFKFDIQGFSWIWGISFILTMRNLNIEEIRMVLIGDSVLY